jgi:hypothetical protein
MEFNPMNIYEVQRRALSVVHHDVPAHLREMWAWLVVFDAEIVLDEGYISGGDSWVPKREKVLEIIDKLRKGKDYNAMAACISWIANNRKINTNTKLTYERLLDLIKFEL